MHLFLCIASKDFEFLCLYFSEENYWWQYSIYFPNKFMIKDGFSEYFIVVFTAPLFYARIAMIILQGYCYHISDFVSVLGHHLAEICNSRKFFFEVISFSTIWPFHIKGLAKWKRKQTREEVGIPARGNSLSIFLYLQNSLGFFN